MTTIMTKTKKTILPILFMRIMIQSKLRSTMRDLTLRVDADGEDIGVKEELNRDRRIKVVMTKKRNIKNNDALENQPEHPNYMLNLWHSRGNRTV